LLPQTSKEKLKYPVRLYRKSLEDERCEFIKRKSSLETINHKNRLDLSMSADPIEDLKSLGKDNKLTEVNTLDLSYAYIKKAQIKELIKIIKNELPNVREIIFSDDFYHKNKALKCAHQIKEQIENVNFYFRKDYITRLDLPMFSLASQIRYGFYDAIPTEEIQLSKKDNESNSNLSI